MQASSPKTHTKYTRIKNTLKSLVEHYIDIVIFFPKPLFFLPYFFAFSILICQPRKYFFFHRMQCFFLEYLFFPGKSQHVRGVKFSCGRVSRKETCLDKRIKTLLTFFVARTVE